MAKFNIKVSAVDNTNKPVFPALYKQVLQEGDPEDYELIVLALGPDQGYIIRDTDDPKSEQTLEDGFSPFNNTKNWTRLPSGTVLEIIQD